MEIKSEPQFREEQVIDLDVGFIGGEMRSVTLHEGDTVIADTDSVQLYFPKTKETIEWYRVNMNWLSRRERTMRWPVPQSATPGTSQPVDSPSKP